MNTLVRLDLIFWIFLYVTIATAQDCPSNQRIEGFQCGGRDGVQCPTGSTCNTDRRTGRGTCCWGRPPQASSPCDDPMMRRGEFVTCTSGQRDTCPGSCHRCERLGGEFDLGLCCPQLGRRGCENASPAVVEFERARRLISGGGGGGVSGSGTGSGGTSGGFGTSPTDRFSTAPDVGGTGSSRSFGATGGGSPGVVGGGADFGTGGGGPPGLVGGGDGFGLLGGGSRGGTDFGPPGGGSRGGADFGPTDGGSRGGADFGPVGGGSRGGPDFGPPSGGSRGGADFGPIGGGSRGGADFGPVGGGSRGGADFGPLSGGSRGGANFGPPGGGSRGGTDIGRMGGGSPAGAGRGGADFRASQGFNGAPSFPPGFVDPARPSGSSSRRQSPTASSRASIGRSGPPIAALRRDFGRAPPIDTSIDFGATRQGRFPSAEELTAARAFGSGQPLRSTRDPRAQARGLAMPGAARMGAGMTRGGAGMRTRSAAAMGGASPCGSMPPVGPCMMMPFGPTCRPGLRCVGDRFGRGVCCPAAGFPGATARRGLRAPRMFPGMPPRMPFGPMPFPMRRRGF